MNAVSITIAEWIAILTLASTVIFGVAKFYAVFTDLRKTLDRLNGTIQGLQESQSEYGNRLVAIEEQIKTLFTQVGGKK
ncbi:hypothetical protein OZ002_02010 [Enterococcus sp. E4-150]|uniref:hypothetical protein n=1 Tax=Enterococcus sp. E4-150 TaxID=3002964 RepID=UPI002D811408|nr:hypothetical protein [Enterococcus sp. E4-150]MEB4785536.1 hypothetical protein [Enterococcus sp. E4-150]